MLQIAALVIALTPAASSVTAAVLTLEHKTGVTGATADVVTEHLADTLRRTGAFSRVVSAKDVETALGIEQQKQLVNCEQASCTAEIAGALGVDYVVAGTLARLGGSYILLIKIISARTGLVASSISKKLKGNSEEALIDAVAPALVQLLQEAGLPMVTPPTLAPSPDVEPMPATTPVAEPASPPSVGTAPVERDAPPGGRRPAWAIPVAVASAVSVAVGVLLVMAALLGGSVLTLATAMVPRFMYVDTQAVVPRQQHTLLLGAVPFVVGGAAAAAAVVGLVVLAAGGVGTAVGAFNAL